MYNNVLSVELFAMFYKGALFVCLVALMTQDACSLPIGQLNPCIPDMPAAPIITEITPSLQFGDITMTGELPIGGSIKVKGCFPVYGTVAVEGGVPSVGTAIVNTGGGLVAQVI